MGKRLLTFIACVLLSVGAALAQTRVSGTVISAEDGQPVVGASVLIKGSTKGVVTDVDGKFTLANLSPNDKTLVVTYLGMDSKEVAIDRSGKSLKITLRPNTEMLSEVVVTAMGISRQEKTLGYSATTVKSDEIIAARTTNAADALAGKVAGVQVSATSGDPGALSNIVIRGFSSINGDNQPLYVIDGVPMQTGYFSGQGKNMSTGGISNVSAEDIESLTVLKGAAATALYGSRAANGVIVITTKKGQAGKDRNFNISYSGSVQARQISYLPDMQNEFGQGWNGVQTFIENGSWGPRLDGSTQVYGPIWNNQQLIHTYSAAEDNVKDFFDIGWMQNHNLAISGVSNDKKMTYYLSYSYTNDDGIMPTDQDSYERNTIAFRNTYEAAKWLTISSSVNYATTSTDAVGSYQGTSVIDGLYEMPRDVSIVDMKDLSSAFNTPEAYFTPYGITNPYWALENNYYHIDSKQIYGKVQLDAKPIKEVTLTYRFGFDYIDYDSKVGYPQIDLDDALINEDYGYAPSNMNQSGYVYAAYGRRHELNHDFMANYANKFLDNKLNISVTAGLNINERKSTSLAVEADDLTFDTGYWDLSNGSTWTTMSESQSKRRLIGLFGDAVIGWDEMVFLELTARNDWSSTLPEDANSFFYPGATVSWIFTNIIPKNDILSFGKLRLAYGKTGNDADPYMTSASYVQGYANGYYGSSIASFPMNGTNAFQKSSTKGSTSLKPEMTKEFEVGLNMQFFSGRVGFDFTYYNRKTTDQIFTLPVDPSTGYSYMVTNFGSVRNQGIELVFNVTPVKTRDFQWDLSFNFAKNNNKVLSLPESLDEGKVSIYSYSAGNDAVYLYAEEGKSMGQFYTYKLQYTDDGQLIVGSDGLPVLTDEVEATGKSINADWTGGVSTSLRYKDFTLSASLDIRKGGYMFSRTANLMQFTGNGSITTYNSREPFIIPYSVVDNGDGTYSENTTPIYQYDGSYQDWYDQGYWKGGEQYLIDRSYVKLRNISLTWDVPRKWVSKLYLSDLSITFFCNNVFTWTASDNLYIDPESTTVSQASYGDLATQFGELYTNPSCRTFGCNLSIKF